MQPETPLITEERRNPATATQLRFLNDLAHKKQIVGMVAGNMQRCGNGVLVGKVPNSTQGIRQSTKGIESELDTMKEEKKTSEALASSAPPGRPPPSPGAATATTVPTRHSLSFSFTTDDEEFDEDDEDGFVVHSTPSSVGLDISSSILAPYFDTTCSNASFTPIRQRVTTSANRENRTQSPAIDLPNLTRNMAVAGGSLSQTFNPTCISASPSSCSTHEELLDRAVDLARRAGVEEVLLGGRPIRPEHSGPKTITPEKSRGDHPSSPRSDDEHAAASVPTASNLDMESERDDSISCVTDTIADIVTSLCSLSPQQQAVERSFQEDKPRQADPDRPDASQRESTPFYSTRIVDHTRLDEVGISADSTSLGEYAAASARAAATLSLSSMSFTEDPPTFLDSICGVRDDALTQPKTTTNRRTRART